MVFFILIYLILGREWEKMQKNNFMVWCKNIKINHQLTWQVLQELQGEQPEKIQKFKFLLYQREKRFFREYGEKNKMEKSKADAKSALKWLIYIWEKKEKTEKKAIRKRWQVIKYDKNGDAFVTHHGTRYYLSDCLSFHAMGMEAIDGATGFFSVGYYMLLVEISPDGEAARVWWKN